MLWSHRLYQAHTHTYDTHRTSITGRFQCSSCCQISNRLSSKTEVVCYFGFLTLIGIISASLSIRIAEQSAYVTEMSSHVCLSAHRYCAKTADWIRMPFGVVSGVGLGRGVLDFGATRSSQITLRTCFPLVSNICFRAI